MKFSINKDILVDSLQTVLGPTTSKQNLPILSSVLLNVFKDQLKLTTTDLDITTIASIKTEIKESGQTVIPMKRFLSIIRELPPQRITIEKNKNNLLIKCEKVEFKISTLNTEEFPQIQENSKASLIKLNPQKIEEMIKLTSFCVGYEDTNYVLGGILFEIMGNKIKLIATDGKRLAFIEKTLPINQPELVSKISFILPIKAVSELHKLLKEKENEIYLAVEENKVTFDLKDTQFIARPLEGEFPNYSQYIPKESKDVLTVDRKQLLFALKRASVLSTADYQGVKLELKKNNLTISKNTPQLGEVKETIETKYGGAHLEIGFNPNYLTDVLKNIDDNEVRIDFFGADKPAVLKKTDYIYLLLPMKI
jgi:DNA polymerase-3 subunit beta